ncbi:HD-GYP domain-containing protein [Alsobacter sp. R-9]
MLRLIIIGESAETALSWSARLGPRCAAVSMGVNEAAVRGFDAGADLIVDIDLGNVEQVQKFITAMRHNVLSGHVRLFAVGEPGGRDHTQAAVLGATGTVTRGASSAEIGALLAGLTLPRPPDLTGVTPGLRRGLDSGHGLVSHFMGGGRVDPVFVDAAAADMTRAVADEGLGRWIEAVRRHHRGTFQHCLLVGGLAAGFASHLGFRRADLHALAVAATLHDVGKARVPAEILDKTSPLTPAEADLLRRHPEEGHAMLTNSGTFDPVTLDVVLHHHERPDGTGYPFGLQGADVSDPVRLVSIIDVFAALIEERSYKPSLPPQAAFEALRQHGPRLDQALVRAFQPVAMACRGEQDDAVSRLRGTAA